MDSATQDLYLQKLEEYVFDQDKIVTIKWLSRSLNINVNDAKHLLEKYVNDQRDVSANSLSTTYILTGTLKDVKTPVVSLVKGEDLANKKDLLEEVLSEHIYSVQKSKLEDMNTLTLVDHIDVHNAPETAVLGSIISKNSVKRIFKAKKVIDTPSAPSTTKAKSFFVKKEPVEVPKPVPKPVAKENKDSSSHKKVDTKVSKNGPGITSFFSKGRVQNENSSNDLANKAKKDSEEKIKNGNVTNADNEKPEITENTQSRSKDQILKNIVDSDDDTENDFKQSSKKSSTKPKPKTNKRSRKTNKKNESDSKRRKRIVEQDSDSDDIFGDANEVDVDTVPSSEDDSPPMIKPEPVLAPKNKRRKLVDQTYTDDDGYILTRKEWVYESGSEDESNKKDSQTLQASQESLKSLVLGEKKQPNKVEAQQSNGKLESVKAKGGKTKKPLATNQPTLMNFFTKK